MVFNRDPQAWELPGGMLDPGESPREAAFRELEEESGQRTPGKLGSRRRSADTRRARPSAGVPGDLPGTH